MMPLLRNPLLRDMNVEDLNQRYADSYCQYKGEPAYIYGFMHGDGGVVIEHAPINIGKSDVKRVQEPFQWDWLNIARPRSGWYVYMGAKAATHFHLAYPNKRQFKRGLCQRNIHLTTPINLAPTQGAYFHAALSDSCPIEIISDDVFDEQRSVIARRDRALLYYKGRWYFYVAHCHAATIAAGRLLWNYPEFKQELAEVNHSSYLKGLPQEVLPVKKPLAQDWEPPEEEEEAIEVMENFDWAAQQYNVFIPEEWPNMGAYACSSIGAEFIKILEHEGQGLGFNKILGSIAVVFDPIPAEQPGGLVRFPTTNITFHFTDPESYVLKRRDVLATAFPNEHYIMAENVLPSNIWNNQRYKLMAIYTRVGKVYDFRVIVCAVRNGDF